MKKTERGQALGLIEDMKAQDMQSVANPALGGNDQQVSQFQRLPAEMRSLRQWCVTVGSATDKAPRKADGHHASSTDPTTWTDFDTACRVAAEQGWRIGFVFTAADPFACINLDVVDEVSQREKGKPVTPEDWTTPEDVERFNSITQNLQSYAEQSRSGKGVHIVVKGNIGKGRRRDGVEIYFQERFMICTGNVLMDLPVADRQDVLNNMVMQMPLTTATEHEMVGAPDPNWALASDASLDVGELGKLFAGDWEGRCPSQSEADLALVKMLLPRADSPRECWETLRLSGLGKRTKAKRSSYARSTMALATQHLANDAAQVQHGQALAASMGLTPTQAEQKGYFWCPPNNPRHFKLLRDGELDQLPTLQWLVKRIIPDAGIGAIYGDSGTPKSFLTLDLLAHISTGKQWFGHKVKPAPAVYVPFEGQGGVPNRIKAWRLAQAKLQNPDALLIVAPPDDVRSNVAVIVEAMNLRLPADRCQPALRT